MILRFPAAQRRTLVKALTDAGEREIGGVLMGEHVGRDDFRVTTLTIQRHGGTVARFVRAVEQAVSALTSFFRQTGNDFTRFNYLGEWHSHPLFPPHPSRQDELSMLRILRDKDVGANFVVLVIVRMVNNQFVATGTLYTRSHKSEVTLMMEEAPADIPRVTRRFCNDD